MKYFVQAKLNLAFLKSSGYGSRHFEPSLILAPVLVDCWAFLEVAEYLVPFTLDFCNATTTFAEMTACKKLLVFCHEHTNYKLSSLGNCAIRL